MVICDSEESRNTLKDQVHKSNSNIEMKTPRENLPVISVVGLSKSYEKEEVVDPLLRQNHFMAQFFESNDVDQHMNVFAVKPLRSKPDVFQAFARVSKVLRQGFKTFLDKVTIGLATCKVYDQYQVKRCNNCQGFGHFYKNCSTPDIHICANCGGDHSTQNCKSLISHCINCANEQVPLAECCHRANDPDCPTMRKIQEKKKNNLNMRS